MLEIFYLDFLFYDQNIIEIQKNFKIIFAGLLSICELNLKFRNSNNTK